MFQEDLKKIIEKEFGPIDKMDSTRKTEVFLEVYKYSVHLMERDFRYILNIFNTKDNA